MSLRILVIEGDPVLRDAIWRLLCEQGHLVELAANGAQAVGGSLRSRFDAVIMDLSLADIGGDVLGRVMEADRARGQASSPALIGLVEHRHSLAVSKVCGGLFKGILSKPLQSGAMLDAIAGVSRRPDEVRAARPPKSQANNHTDPSHAARDLSAAHWRRCGLQARPRVVVCPRPTPDQEKALKLCFDMVAPQDADLVILLERHGMAEAKRLPPAADNGPRPIIALSSDHADICAAVFEITSETSWRKVASLVRRDWTPPGLLSPEEIASDDADMAMPTTCQNDGDDLSFPTRERCFAEAKGTLALDQTGGEIIPLASVGGGANGSGHWTRRMRTTAPIGDGEAVHKWNGDDDLRAGAHVLLLEGAENGGLGLTLALAKAGHLVCRVQDPHGSLLATGKTLFDVAVIAMSERHCDLPDLVRSLRGAQHSLPIILVGSDLSGKERHDLARLGGISFLATVRAQENLVQSVSAAIAGGAQARASAGR